MATSWTKRTEPSATTWDTDLILSIIWEEATMLWQEATFTWGQSTSTSWTDRTGVSTSWTERTGV